MEQKFTVELTMNKKHHREFGYLHINRRKSWIIRFVLIILLMLLLICTALFTAHINRFLLFSTVLYYFTGCLPICIAAASPTAVRTKKRITSPSV